MSDPLTVGVGGYDVLRLDPSTDLPIVSAAYASGPAFRDLLHGDATGADLADIGAEVADLGGTIAQVLMDPFGWLIQTGLGFLVDVVQPLDDLLGLVTGNPERMAADIAQLRTVAADLRGLAAGIADATASHLVGWQGEAADAATAKLSTFVAGVEATAVRTDQFAAALELVKAVMEIAQTLVLQIISALVEWMVFTWISAITLAVPSAGASTAAAALATEAEAGIAASRAVRVIDRVTVILERLGEVMARLGGTSLRAISRAGFETVGEGGRLVVKPLVRTLVDASVREPRVVVPLAGKGAAAAAKAGSQGALGGDPSWDDITEALDPPP